MVVTGVAMTTSVATDAETTWKALLDGQSGIRTLDDPFVEQYDLPVRIGGHLLEDFDGELTRVELRRLSYLQKMSTVIGRRAWQNAGSPEVDTASADGVDRHRHGVQRGTALRLRRHCEPEGCARCLHWRCRCTCRTRPPPRSDWNATPRPACITPISACASGSEAIANAWRNIVLGEADIAICGGVETKIEAVPIAGFAQMRIVLSTTNDDPTGACRPFDRDRNGFVFGEGGALMVIETEEHAQGARVPTSSPALMGASVTSDGYHIVAPDPNGEQAGHAMTRAIQLAGLSPTDIDHVNAHATGTSVGDVAEGKAINNAMGSHRPAVYAPKSALGHSVGAVGAVESILTVLALRDGVIPPTLNLENLDPEIDLDVVAGEPRAPGTSGTRSTTHSDSAGTTSHSPSASTDDAN